MRNTISIQRHARALAGTRGSAPIMTPPPKREEPCADCGRLTPVVGLKLRPDPTGAARNRKVCSACAVAA